MWWSNVIGGECRRTWRDWWSDTASPISANILHTLFVPMSFLVLVRLSTAQSHFYDFYVGSGQDDGFFPFFLYLCFNSIILYLLLSFLAVAAFLHTLTGGRVILIHLLLCRWNDSISEDSRLHRPRLPRGLQLCAVLVLAELTIEFYQSPLTSLSGHYRRNGRAGGWLFAVGLYETLINWLETVVKVVIDDEAIIASLDDEMRKKRRRRMVMAERIGLVLSFGALWWWRLRDQVDYLLLAAEKKDDHGFIVLKMATFVSIGLYYLTLVTGAIRCFTGVTGMLQLIIRWSIGKSKITQPPGKAEETV